MTDQFLGLQQPYSYPAPYGFGAPYTASNPYVQGLGSPFGSVPPMVQSPFGTQFTPWTPPIISAPVVPQAQQVIQALASQIAPVAQQAILPAVFGAVHQLTLLITQLAMAHVSGQQAAWSWPQGGWPSPQLPSQPMTGSFGQFTRPAYQY